MTTDNTFRQLTDRIDILIESGDITPKAGVALRSLVEQLRRAEATKDIDQDDDTYGDTRFCTNCKKETHHACHDSGHERDSSYDWQRCLECGWTYRGMTGKYSPN